MTDQISAKAEAFLAGRRLDIETGVKLGVGSEDTGSGEALVLPFIRKGKVVRRKFRGLDEKKFWQDKGGVRCAWNEDVLRDDSLIGEPVIITEGELDAWAAIQSGFQRVISVPDGAPPPGEREEADLRESQKYAWLVDLEREGLLAKDRVPNGFILAVDGDENGAALQLDLAMLLHKVRCKFLVYPKAPAKVAERLERDRLKDLGEVLEHYGERGVKDCIGRASWIRVEGVFAMSDLPPLPKARVYEIGFGAYGEHFKFRLGDFSVFTGTPGSGKSTFLNDVACRVAWAHGFRVAWASFEQKPQRDHRRALRCWHFDGNPRDMAPADYAKADRWIDELHRFIVPSDDDDAHLDWLLEKMEAAVIQHGCRWIVIDPWNELEHDRRPGESETEYTGRAIRLLKRFASAFECHVTVVAHPTKMRRGEDGKVPTPTLYDISGSANFANKADLGVIVHRLGEKTFVTTAKSRYHDQIGKPGMVEMAYCHDTRRFSEIERLPDSVMDPDQPLPPARPRRSRQEPA